MTSINTASDIAVLIKNIQDLQIPSTTLKQSACNERNCPAST